MKHRVLLALAAAFLVGSAHASPRAVVAFSFVCNGAKSGPCPNGANPNSLIQATDGNFYGTTTNSGTNANGQFILGGTVFSLTAGGKFTLLHTFTQGTTKKFADGAAPVSLTEGPDGNLYGFTTAGGNNFGSHFLGYGVLFRMSKTGSGFHVIHRFCSKGIYCDDGVYGAGVLLAGSDGNVYGVTSQGGGGVGCASGGCGTIFRVTPASGTYEVVFSFGSVDGGGFPVGMSAGADGTFYGLTINGNAMFHFSPASGALESVTLPFPLAPGCPGFACTATGAFALDGNVMLHGLYAVYGVAGASGVFEVQGDGSHFKVLPEFTTVTGPGTELLLASDGNLWSPLSAGAFGEIVALSPSDGKVVQTITPFGPSVFAPAEIMQARDGTLWGVSAGGIVSGSGHYSAGAVFKINAGLPPK